MHEKRHKAEYRLIYLVDMHLFLKTRLLSSVHNHVKIVISGLCKFILDES